MSLEQTIHQRWAADAALGALLPAERVTTGRATCSKRPYATIVRTASRPALRTNAGDAVDEVTLRIDIWHDRHHAGQAILQQVKAAFDRSDFALPGGQRVIQMRRTSDVAVQHDDGLWQFTIEFLVQVYLPRGV